MRHSDSSVRRARLGLLAATGAFVLWGLFPFYWERIDYVSDLEVTLHRVFWSALLAWPIVIVSRALDRRRAVRTSMADATGGAGPDGRAPGSREVARGFSLVPALGIIWPLLLGGVLISFNWFTYVYAVTGGLTLDASLGYYINPLLSIFIGMLVFHERLTRLQWAALFLASIGVAWLTIRLGVFPWISLVLASTFGTYGVIKKVTRLQPIHSLAIELTVPALVAFTAILVMRLRGAGTFLTGDTNADIFLSLGGAVTVAPLLLFAFAAQRVRLADVGFLQYIAPTMIFFIAVLYFRDPLEPDRLAGFMLVWIALGLYTVSIVRGRGRRSVPRGGEPSTTTHQPVATREREMP